MLDVFAAASRYRASPQNTERSGKALHVENHHDDGFVIDQITIGPMSDNPPYDQAFSVRIGQCVAVSSCTKKVTHRFKEAPVFRTQTTGVIQRRGTKRRLALFDRPETRPEEHREGEKGCK